MLRGASAASAFQLRVGPLHYQRRDLTAERTRHVSLHHSIRASRAKHVPTLNPHVKLFTMLLATYPTSSRKVVFKRRHLTAIFLYSEGTPWLPAHYRMHSAGTMQVWKPGSHKRLLLLLLAIQAMHARCMLQSWLRITEDEVVDLPSPIAV